MNKNRKWCRSLPEKSEGTRNQRPLLRSAITRRNHQRKYCTVAKDTRFWLPLRRHELFLLCLNRFFLRKKAGVKLFFNKKCNFVFLAHSGRHKIVLSEQGKDLIRLEFHKLSIAKINPTTTRLFKRLQNDFEDFPIHAESALRGYEKKL